MNQNKNIWWFCDLNVPEHDKEGNSLTLVSIDSLLVFDRQYCLQVYLDNCAYKTVNKAFPDILDENIFGC